MMTTQKTGALICALLLCISILPGSVAGGATVSQEPDANIDQSVLQDEVGDIVDIPITLPAGEQATVSIVGAGLEQDVVVADRDSDGKVVVSLNTYEVNRQSGEGYSAKGADSIISIDESSFAPLQQGQYTVELAVDNSRTDTSTLVLKSGTFGDSSLRAAPQMDSYNRTAVVEASHPVNETVAYGDLAVLEFDVEGIEGVGRYTEPPGDNLVYSERDRETDTNTHTVTASAGSNGTQFSSLSVTYDGNQGISPDLSNHSLEHFGVDTDNDGQIEQNLNRTIDDVTVTNSTVSLSLSEVQTLGSNESVLIQYSGVRDPETAGEHLVHVSVGSHSQTGTIAYGTPGFGEFGNGVGIDINSTMSSPIIGPLSYDYYFADDDTAYVVFDTSVFEETHSQSVNVTIWKGKATDGKRIQTATAGFQLVNRTATVDVSNKSLWKLNSSEAPVTGETTLAPGSEISLRLMTNSSSPELQTKYITVGPNRNFSVQFSLLNQLREGVIEITVREDGERISKIYRLQYF